MMNIASTPGIAAQIIWILRNNAGVSVNNISWFLIRTVLIYLMINNFSFHSPSVFHRPRNVARVKLSLKSLKFIGCVGTL